MISSKKIRSNDYENALWYGICRTLNRRDGVVVRASTSQSIDWDSFPFSSHTKRL